MKLFLKDILPNLKKYSASLDQTSLLVDKPWVVANSKENFEKLIFKRNGELYMSSNGDVTKGNWEYFPEANSMLIEYGSVKKLYQHQYLDEAVLALKLDGNKNSDDNYFLLANENIVADLDVKRYLEKKIRDQPKLVSAVYNSEPLYKYNYDNEVSNEKNYYVTKDVQSGSGNILIPVMLVLAILFFIIKALGH